MAAHSSAFANQRHPGVQALRRTVPLLQNDIIFLRRSHNIDIPIPNSDHQQIPALQSRQLDTIPLARRFRRVDIPGEMALLGLGGDSVGDVAKSAGIAV